LVVTVARAPIAAGNSIVKIAIAELQPMPLPTAAVYRWRSSLRRSVAATSVAAIRSPLSAISSSAGALRDVAIRAPIEVNRQPLSCNGDHRGMLGSGDQVAVTGNISTPSRSRLPTAGVMQR
jgi:hypothetical protein